MIFEDYLVSYDRLLIILRRLVTWPVYDGIEVYIDLSLAWKYY